MKAALSDARFIICNREPFANVASQIKRYENNIYLGVPRSEAITHLAELWLYRSRLLLEAQREEHFEMTSYEEFCTNPKMIVEAFGLSAQVKLRRDYRVQVKDYAKTEITNMNERQVSKLSSDEIELIREVLSRDSNVVRQFGCGFDI